MKQLILAASLLVISTVVLANPNSPANRCKRYAHANAFDQTVAQLCGTQSNDVYKGVLTDQSCDKAMGSEEAVKQEGQLQRDELQAEYRRIGAKQFCAKYQGRQ